MRAEKHRGMVKNCVCRRPPPILKSVRTPLLLAVITLGIGFVAIAKAQVAGYVPPSLTSVGSISAASGTGGDQLTANVTYSLGSGPAPMVVWSFDGPQRLSLTDVLQPAGRLVVPITGSSIIGNYTLSSITLLDQTGQTVYLRNGSIQRLFYSTPGLPTTHSYSFASEDFSITAPVAPRITTQPLSVRAAVGTRAVLSVVATGAPAPNYQWRKNQAAILGAQSSSYTISALTLGDAGIYDVVVTNRAGSIASSPATIAVDTAPIITTHPESQIAALGSQVSLRVTANGTEPMTYQWLKNGTPLSGITTPTLLISSVVAADDGVYFCVVTNSLGQATSNGASLTVAPPSTLSNLSVRTTMAVGQTLTVGFVVNNNGVKSLLLRAAGPALNGFGLSGLPNPMLTPYRGSTIINQNDDWPSSLAPIFTSLGAFGFADNSRDAALTMTGIQGSNSAVVASSSSPLSTGTPSGTVLVEVYDTSPSTTSRLINVSARTRVGTGADLLIAGFTVSGTGTMQLLIRGMGPALTAFGVPGALTDPKLEVFSSAGKIGENDDWDPILATTFSSVGAFAPLPGSKDSAVIVTVAAGASYTAQVSGVGGGTGEALVEVYELP